MGSNLITQLTIVDNFGYSLRNFFGPIVKFIYYLIAQSVDLMYNLAGNHFGLDVEIDNFVQSIYFILIIFMIFKLTIALLNYIINPDSFFDKSTGFGKLIIRILVSIILLVSINPIFRLLYNIQDDIIQNNTIENVLLGSSSAGVTITDGNGTINDVVYKIRMDDNCPEDYYIYSFSKGESLSVMVLQPFYTLNAPTKSDLESEDEETRQLAENMNTAINDYKANGYCGYKLPEDNKMSIDVYNAFVSKGIGSASDLVEPQIYTFMVDDKEDRSLLESFGCTAASDLTTMTLTAKTNSQLVGSFIAPYVQSFAYKHCRKTLNTVKEITGHEEYVVNFSYFWALIFGIVIFLLLISFCFDVVIRAFTLFFYQLIAPIPIIMNMSPSKKDADVLINWVKKVGGCWASLFVRLATLDLVIYLIMIIRSNTNVVSDLGLVAQLFMIIGALMFAKKLPHLIEEVIPGLKLGGLQLNPFKRISQEAVGGNAILGAGAALGAAGLSAGTNFAQRAIETGKNVKQAGSWRDKLAALGSGITKTAGSTVAGATRGGINAFGRTSKDGKIFTGAWGGYQTAMFSKLQREDNLRKAGVDPNNISDRLKFTAESAVADASRYAGVLNEGQREYLIQSQIELDVKKMEKEHEAKQRPLKLYGEYMSFIDGKIKVQDDVKNAQALYDAAFSADYKDSNGNDDLVAKQKAIEAAKKRLDTAKLNAFQDLSKNNAQVKSTISAINALRADPNNNLTDRDYDISKADGGFNSKAMYTAQDQVSVMNQQHAEEVYQFKYGTGENSVTAKYGHDYDYYQQEVTRPKVANDSRITKEGQGPGYKPSPDRLGNIRDTQYFGGGRGFEGRGRGRGPVNPGGGNSSTNSGPMSGPGTGGPH